MQSRGAGAYRALAAATAPPAKLVVLLYRRAVQSIRRSIAALDRHDLASAHNELVRAEDILLELQAQLNREVDPLASDLGALYDYFRRTLMDANLRKDPEPAIRVAELLDSLLQAWEVALAPKARRRL